MARAKPAGDLCSGCGHAPYCFYLATRGPVSDCPLHQDAKTANRPRREAAEAPSPDPPEAPGGPPPRPKLKGLCVNCEHRLTCAHALRTGGVWHCENYE